jgi:hypothetical protein
MAGNLTLWDQRMASDNSQVDPEKNKHHLKFSGKNMHNNRWSFKTCLSHSTLGIQYGTIGLIG